MPKIDGSFEFEHGLQGFNNDEPFCRYRIKRIANDLNIEFNAYQEESHIIIFERQNNGFNIIYKIETL
ncbi:hypothetical protein [Helicobacter sp. MIT 05-5294]|uniref:hypothetical protein n=1 Tax=Helicobacter sp. MIT 05-5294 TaxID=1548150 RepID=UPI0010FF623A|nr:hypothetical protein [Helicobacter sp. MIT 05-5294]TLD83453.1 hypothetical protein LS69_010090 [Helicobacter sp. MIT 05-5294]